MQFKSFEFVKLLLDARDNIIDQLILLRKYQDNEEVQEYIDYLLKSDISLYDRYCIDKYYFLKEVEEVSFNDYYNEVFGFPAFRDIKKMDYIRNMINQVDTFEEMVDLLATHRDDKIVCQYVLDALASTDYGETPYFRYLFLKRFFGINLKEVKPTPKTLKYHLWGTEMVDMLEGEIISFKQKLKKVKNGSKVVMTDGPFKSLRGEFVLYDGSDYVEVKIDSLQGMIVGIYFKDIRIEGDDE